MPPLASAFWGHALAYGYLTKVPFFLGEQFERRDQRNGSKRRESFHSAGAYQYRDRASDCCPTRCALLRRALFHRHNREFLASSIRAHIDLGE